MVKVEVFAPVSAVPFQVKLAGENEAVAPVGNPAETLKFAVTVLLVLFVPELALVTVTM
jgi:hypothetical protein